MIANIKFLEKYCKDYKNIENYEAALKSPLKYDLHHRREIFESKSIKDLKEENLYYYRPPEELVFLEHRDHVSLHNKGKFVSTDTRKKISAARKGKPSPWLGKHPSEDTRKKMSEANRGEKNPMFGRHWHQSEETRKKLSEAKKGKPKSVETRKKLSEANRGKPKSVETRKKISEARKGRHWHIENGKRVYTE